MSDGFAGSRMMTFAGRSSGGLTFVHAGEGASAFVVLNTCPLRPPESKLPYAAYNVLGFRGSNARLLTVRVGRLAPVTLVQLVPPLVVSQIFPSVPSALVPNAYVLQSRSDSANAIALTSPAFDGPLADQVGFAALKKSLVRHSRVLRVRKTSSFAGHFRTSAVTGATGS